MQHSVSIKTGMQHDTLLLRLLTIGIETKDTSFMTPNMEQISLGYPSHVGQYGKSTETSHKHTNYHTSH